MKDTFVVGIVQPSLRRCCSKSVSTDGGGGEEHDNGGDDDDHDEEEDKLDADGKDDTEEQEDDTGHHHPLLVEARRVCDMMIQSTTTTTTTTTTDVKSTSAKQNPSKKDAGTGDDDTGGTDGVAVDVVDMYVLPELCPVGYTEETFLKYLPSTPELQDVFHQIDQMLATTAKQLCSYICYGTIGWKPKKTMARNPSESSTNYHTYHNNSNHNYYYYIRQKVVDSNGTLVTQYDKVHLCDYGDCRETTWFTPGGGSGCGSSGSDDSSSDDDDSSSDVGSDGSSTVVSTFIHDKAGWKVGLQICADIRNAASARKILLDGYHHHHHQHDGDGDATKEEDDDEEEEGNNKNNNSNIAPGDGDEEHIGSSSVTTTTHVILQPSCFSRDVSFPSWKHFRTTRAIENGVYWVGINYAGEYFGESSCTSPCLISEQEQKQEEKAGQDPLHHHEKPFVAGCDEGIYKVRLYKETIRYAREDMPRYYQTIIREHLANLK